MTGNVLSGSLSFLMVNLTGSDIEADTLQYRLSTPISTGSIIITAGGILSYIPSI